MSDIARVYANGKEPAVLTTTLTVPAVAGKEPGVVSAPGQEKAKPGGDLAK